MAHLTDGSVDRVGMTHHDDGTITVGGQAANPLVYIEGPPDSPTIRLGEDAVIDWSGPRAGNIRHAADPVGRWGVGFYEESTIRNRDGREVQQAVLYRALDELPRGTRVPIDFTP